ncbi:MAG: DTW domain-containing protein [Opitutaceae bacterium]|nr:DTW domain-containing protein [Opitutaceae bacterium]
MSRVMCYRCFWPGDLCWCDSLPAVPTRTRFVILMHPKEFKQEKAGTGRLTHLSLPNSEIQVGIEFDAHPAVQRLLVDPKRHVVLLYPGKEAANLSREDVPFELPAGQELVVLVLDATWSCARKMLKLSPSLQRLPRVMFTPSTPSRYVIKQQPFEGCLSTLESVREVIRSLHGRGVEPVNESDALLTVFDRMQQVQIDCARDPDRGGYRRGEYGKPGEREPLKGKSGRRRANYFELPTNESK